MYHDSQYIHLITSLGFEIHEETSWSLAIEFSIFLEGILPPPVSGSDLDCTDELAS